MFTYNTTPHAATEFTPFELYGNQAILPTALTKQPKQTYSYDDYAQELRERIRYKPTCQRPFKTRKS